MPKLNPVHLDDEVTKGRIAEIIKGAETPRKAAKRIRKRTLPYYQVNVVTSKRAHFIVILYGPQSYQLAFNCPH